MSTKAGPADAARDLRRRVGAAPDETLELDRDEVVKLLAPPSVNGDDPEETARFAQAMLRLHGVRVRPRLSDAGAVRATLRVDRGLAVQGALVVTVLALLVGWVGRPLYGILLGLAGAIGVALVAWRFDWLDEHVPKAVPRGRSLGAVLSIVPAAIVLVAVVLPIREHRRTAGDPGRAAAFLQGARQSLAAGDVLTAQNRLVQAEQADHNAFGLDDVRASITVAQVQNLLNDQARKEGLFDEAERAFAAGNTAQAIALMTKVSGFRNADQRLAAYKQAERRHRR